MKLYLSNHPQFRRQWLVRGMRVNWRPPFEGYVTSFDSLSPFGYEAFERRCEELGVEIVWKDDPNPIFEWFDSLNNDPGVEVQSDMEGTYRGFFPFQIQGINFMWQQSGLFEWSTGTGKTLGLEGVMLKNMEEGNFDLYLTVVKRNNKTNTQRKFLNQAGIVAPVLDGDYAKREELYIELLEDMNSGSQPVAIMNWEKFREDAEAFMILVENRRVFVAFDEMSDKIRNRETQLWRAIAKVFFTSFTSHRIKKGPDKGKMKNIFYPSPDPAKWRTAHHQFLGMTATPIINSPMDYINIVHLLDPTVFGSIRAAEDLIVAKRHHKYRHPIAWKNLDRLEQMTAHVVHQVDKDDPDIAKFFPKVEQEVVWLDLDPHDRAIYNRLQDEYKKMQRDELSILSREDILAAIGTLGMICSNPLSVLRSALLRKDYEMRRSAIIGAWEEVGVEGKDLTEMIAKFDKREMIGSAIALRFVQLYYDLETWKEGEPVNLDKLLKVFTDSHSAKLDMLVDDLEKHESKALVFTKMNDSLVPFLSEALDDVGITHVTYTGGMSDKRLQAIQDEFKGNPAIKVFLSSDAGSDSIDLEEANLAIDYDLPYTHARLVQRRNRKHRITSSWAKVYDRTYLTADTVEERFYEIILEKQWYQEATTGGAIKSQAQALRKSDLLYVLTGSHSD